MEPRPPKSTRPVPGIPSPVASPPPVPTAERLASRPAWIDTGGREESGALDPALASAITPLKTRGGVWRDPDDESFDGSEGPIIGGLRSPLSPVVSPRGERRSRFIGPILAALLLVLVIGGAAFAFDKARDGSDSRNAADATSTARSVAGVVGSPPATSTTAAGDQAEVTPTVGNDAPSGNATSAGSGAVSTESGGAAASPTEAAGAASGNEGDAEPTATKRAATTEPTERPNSGTVRAADVLPSANDLPDGFTMTREGSLKKADVAAAHGDGGDDLLTEWKWRENAFREFTIEGADPDTTFFLSVSVHRTGDRDGSGELLDALADALGAIPGYEEVDVAKIGDQTRALTSSDESANVYALYVRDGYLVYRLGGSSVSGDPSADVIALAKQLVGK